MIGFLNPIQHLLFCVICPLKLLAIFKRVRSDAKVTCLLASRFDGKHLHCTPRSFRECFLNDLNDRGKQAEVLSVRHTPKPEFRD